MNKLNFLNKGISTPMGVFVLLAVALLAGGVMVWQNQQLSGEDRALKTIANNGIVEWRTYANAKYGFEFKYPEKFGANVWEPYFWPPKATVVPVGEDPLKKGCPGFPVGIQGANQSKVRISNLDYTFYRGSEGAMGSSYASYCYATEKDQNYYVLSFVVRSVNGCGTGDNCGPYCGTKYETECKNLDRAKDIEKPIEKIVSTFKFLK